MQEDKETKPSATAGDAGAGQDAPAEATSSETLSEVEETEKVSPEKSGAGGSAMPSPDGAFDSERGRSPKDDSGPM